MKKYGFCFVEKSIISCGFLVEKVPLAYDLFNWMRDCFLLVEMVFF